MIEVDFPKEHPRCGVADHEVLLAFNGDDEARKFRDWLREQGLTVFNAWVILGAKTDGPMEPCCECGEPYPRRDLIEDSEIYCPTCRAKEAKREAARKKRK